MLARRWSAISSRTITRSSPPTGESMAARLLIAATGAVLLAYSWPMKPTPKTSGQRTLQPADVSLLQSSLHSPNTRKQGPAGLELVTHLGALRLLLSRGSPSCQSELPESRAGREGAPLALGPASREQGSSDSSHAKEHCARASHGCEHSRCQQARTVHSQEQHCLLAGRRQHAARAWSAHSPTPAVSLQAPAHKRWLTACQPANNTCVLTAHLQDGLTLPTLDRTKVQPGTKDIGEDGPAVRAESAS